MLRMLRPRPLAGVTVIAIVSIESIKTRRKAENKYNFILSCEENLIYNSE